MRYVKIIYLYFIYMRYDLCEMHIYIYIHYPFYMYLVSPRCFPASVEKGQHFTLIASRLMSILRLQQCRKPLISLAVSSP